MQTELNFSDLRETRRAQYIGTFKKVNGQVRTMRFEAFRTELAKGMKQGMLKVWDIEERAFRTFVFSKQIGELIPA